MCFKDYLAQKLNKRLDILGTFVRGKFTFRGHFPGIGEVGIDILGIFVRGKFTFRGYFLGIGEVGILPRDPREIA